MIKYAVIWELKFPEAAEVSIERQLKTKPTLYCAYSYQNKQFLDFNFDYATLVDTLERQNFVIKNGFDVFEYHPDLNNYAPFDLTVYHHGP